MPRQCVCVAIILITVALDVIAQNRTQERCGVLSEKNQFPWLVGLEYYIRPKENQCTGALLTLTHILTNAVCFDNLIRGEKRQEEYKGANITVIAGSCIGGRDDKGCKDDETIRVPVETLIIHPMYTGRKDIYKIIGFSIYDYAVLKLHDPLSYSDFIRPICLPTIDITKVYQGDLDLYITGLHNLIGYGRFSSGLSKGKSVQEKGCIWDPIKIEDEICVRDTQTFPSCASIGSLVMNKRKDRYELVGLEHHWLQCTDNRLFSNLFLHLDWIRSNTVGSTSLSSNSWSDCGVRKVEHTELIVLGKSTKIGDWPWHSAIYRLHKFSIQYICGGTLISKTIVLTAAHCVTIRGETVNPEILSVVLGKYNLIGRDLHSQEKEVHSVIVHENFAPDRHLENDIALLKLKTEATYNDYVQPACIWSREANDRLPSDRDIGTVVGWGIDQLEQLSPQLKQADMPKVPDVTCIRKNPLFYSTVLENNKKFCAGWANGTSPCNGDSGGGFLMFVPQTAKDVSADALGSWYVRGIVSLTAVIRNRGQCDPNQYVVFTDVDKYTEWIQRYLVK